MVELGRREALRLFGGAAVTSVLLPAKAGASRGKKRVARFLTARSRSDGAHGGAILSAAGDILMEFDLPGRGHGAALRPDRKEAVIFARRPGNFAVVLDLATGRPGKVFAAPSDRHFYGHGSFSADGRVLFTTENDFEGERGVIGLYNAREGYRRIGEFYSHGIGPHEIALMPDRRTLLVANGGILTHPDAPRMKLNLAEMRSSIALIDVEDGALIQAFELPAELRQLSLRHVATRADGRIVAVAQWEGTTLAQPPLVAVIDRDRGLRLRSAPDEIVPRMRNYCGSVAFSRDGQHFAVSSPRGGIITLWDADGGFLRAVDLEDGCGLAALGDGFLMTSGRGVVAESSGAQTRSHRRIAFDNHLAAF